MSDPIHSKAKIMQDIFFTTNCFSQTSNLKGIGEVGKYFVGLSEDQIRIVKFL